MGFGVGIEVGFGVGPGVGIGVGFMVGPGVGIGVGSAVGPTEGLRDGDDVMGARVDMIGDGVGDSVFWNGIGGFGELLL